MPASTTKKFRKNDAYAVETEKKLLWCSCCRKWKWVPFKWKHTWCRFCYAVRRTKRKNKCDIEGCEKEAIWTIAGKGCSPWFSKDGTVRDLYPSTIDVLHLCQEHYEEYERMKQ